MTTAVETVPADMTLHQAATFLTAPTTTHPSFPVVDAANRVLGILDPPAVLRWRRAGTLRTMALRDLLPTIQRIEAYPDEYLDVVIERMSRDGAAHIPVVSRADGTLVGYLGWRDLMLVRAQTQAEERDRTAFYRFPRRGSASITPGNGA